MESTDNSNNNDMEKFEELKQKISRLEEKIESIEYMQHTINAMVHLDEINEGLPVSRTDLANELKIHPNTAYIRAEKLVQKHKFLKYYGRELGHKKFEEKKAVYYSLFRTLYSHEIVSELENKNKSAYMVAMTLLQQQPLPEKDLLSSEKLTEKDIRMGVNYLVSRGFIIKEIKNKIIYYRIRKIDQEEIEEKL